jgi:oxaloacetate decarboxylase beta subunit
MLYLESLAPLTRGIMGLAWQNVVMMAVGSLLIWLAVKHGYEPLLLLPIGFGCILVNIPYAPLIEEGGLLDTLYHAGISNGLFPSLIFLGIGAMTDFGPLMENPKYVLFGAAAEFGCFAALLLAMLAGFNTAQSAAIAIIGSADGPTAILVASLAAPEMLGAVSVAAYSYIAMVPVIQPPIIRLLTTRRERAIRMPNTSHSIPKIQRIVFPIAVTLVCGLLAPESLPLIGMLMFGNLARESGVVDRIEQAAHHELSNIVIIFLGITVGSTMNAQRFLRVETLMILGLGLLAFMFGTSAGLLLGKLMNLISGGRFNPLIGGCGISAFPMSARVAQRLAHEEDPDNFILMHGLGASTSGLIASVITAGYLLSLVH